MSIKNIIRGNNTYIHEYVNLYNCKIGDNTKIGPFVEIQTGVCIGNNCKIQSHSFICEGVSIHDGVFIGHGVMFCNDRFPRSINKDGTIKKINDWNLEPTIIKNNASIGSNSTILCGIIIGENSIVGAGSVVTKNVPDNEIWAGNPARFLRKISTE